MLAPCDKLEIIALYAAYNRAIDGGDAAAWARTFVENGVFEHPMRGYRGTTQLEGFVLERTEKLATHPVAHQRHWNDALRLDGDGGIATGTCDLIVAGVKRDTAAPLVLASGSYRDELVKVGTEWRFSKRTLQLR
ncbi:MULTISPECIES: nuclear transport factor 2 family protein [Cupriavidus]|uniref:nuclear transport factor 2 family protein n=1 Tax=Cupriavidus TaxID=106589 RepID=UPI00157B8AD7|nr:MULTISPECIES: nuclear transport factor 2 family protein [Cupriavidus]MBB1632495.1 hypothetical protein [Cupriavidus sp. UME77]NUA32104.1 nuclear transport factor 2 family protein [Cupriavidus basilensis]